MQINLTGYNPLQDMIDYARVADRTEEEIVAFGLSALKKAGIMPETVHEKATVLTLLAETFMEVFSRSNSVK